MMPGDLIGPEGTGNGISFFAPEGGVNLIANRKSLRERTGSAPPR